MCSDDAIYISQLLYLADSNSMLTLRRALFICLRTGYLLSTHSTYTYNRNPYYTYIPATIMPYYTYIPTTITYTYNNNIYLQQ